MVFVIHGWIGLEIFRNERLSATKALYDFKDGNCFHDGKNRLRVVDRCLAQILEERRRSDNISEPLVYMVKDMLNEDPAARPNCVALYHRARRCIKESEDRYVEHQNGASKAILPLALSPAPLPSGPVPNHPNEVMSRPYSHQISNYVPPTASSSSFIGSPPSTNLEGSDWRSPELIRPTFTSAPSNGAKTIRSDQIEGFPNPVLPPFEPISSTEDMLPTTPPPGHKAVPETPTSSKKTKAIEPPPHPPARLSVQESFAWKKDHKKKKSRSGFSRIFTPDKNKYLDFEGKDHLNELKDRDHVHSRKPQCSEDTR